ncbi:MAG: aldose 1-epimerase family protein [Anaerolineaceae bacterium]
MAKIWGKEYTKIELLRRIGDISQIASAQAVELVDGNERGVRAVILRNAAGLELTVAAERGMSITDLRYKGVPLPFFTGVGTVHPAYGDLRGLNWLRTWPAGFMTTCGLTQVGSPTVDNGEELGQHGRAAGVPARNLAWGGEWQKNDYVVWVSGCVHEVAMSNYHLQLTRRIYTGLSEKRFWVEDEVENLGFTPAPHMFLQHINLGFPLVDSTARLELPPHTPEPRDEAARAGLESYTTFDDPQPGYREQVFYHYLHPDDHGKVEVRLINPIFNNGQGLGVALRYSVADYPVLVEWKQMGEGFYAVGLEPANCRVSGRVAERENGTLEMLNPGEVRKYKLEIAMLWT